MSHPSSLHERARLTVQPLNAPLGFFAVLLPVSEFPLTPNDQATLIPVLERLAQALTHTASFKDSSSFRTGNCRRRPGIML